MSQENFCFFTELNAIKASGDKDLNTLMPAVKVLLLKERKSQGFTNLRNAPFGMVKIILDNETPEFNIALKRMEAEEEIKGLQESHSIGKFGFSTLATFLILHYNAVKPIIGEQYFDILKDIFQESYDQIISSMEKEIVVIMKDVLGEYPHWSNHEKHKTEFAIHYKEKYTKTYFEKIVYDFVDDYLIHGEPLPMAINSKFDKNGCVIVTNPV